MAAAAGDGVQIRANVVVVDDGPINEADSPIKWAKWSNVFMLILVQTVLCIQASELLLRLQNWSEHWHRSWKKLTAV